MTPQDKAKAGLWLLKQAVMDYLETQPNSTARPNEVREALQLLDKDRNGGHKGYLLWGLANLLDEEGTVRTDPIGGVSYMILAKPDKVS